MPPTARETSRTEWGLGQVLPLKKDCSRLLQLGLIGYDQWQVSGNGGTIGSVHGIGFQNNFIVPPKNLNLVFNTKASTGLADSQGRTIVFGFSWTLRIPKPVLPRP